jgi:UDP-glucose 4-epimerase
VRVALTGATGLVGRFVATDLRAAGHDVVAWRRPSTDTTGTPAGITWIAGGLETPPSAAALVAGADALVHAAFQHLPGRYRGGEGDDPVGFLRTNLEGSLHLLEAARRAGVARVVFLSSRAVYGPRLPNRPLDEQHPLQPTTHYGAYKAAVEAIVRGYGKAEGLAWASLRPTGVFGLAHPVERSKWADVVAACRAGRTPAARGGTEIWGPDLARAVRLLLEAPVDRVAGEAFNVSDTYVTHRSVARLVGGPLPAPSAGPDGLMATGKLQALGWRPAGWRAVEATVRDLIAALQSSPVGTQGTQT